MNGLKRSENQAASLGLSAFHGSRDAACLETGTDPSAETCPEKR
jgi:hypothetical protein